MSNKSLIDFFKLLVTMDILDNIVDQTNLYGNQFFEKHSAILPSSRLHSWKQKLSISELLKFLALIVVMGVVEQVQHCSSRRLKMDLEPVELLEWTEKECLKNGKDIEKERV